MAILLKCAKILTLNDENDILDNAEILIVNGKIRAVGNNIPVDEHTECLDLSDSLIMPGLVNAHTHSPMIILRSLADDCNLEKWLQEHIWPAEQIIDKDIITCAVKYSIMEMLSYGITSFSDMYKDSLTVAEAIVPTGIKANIADSLTFNGNERYNPATHKGTIENEELIRKWNNHDSGRIKTDTSIQSQWQSTPELWQYISTLATKENIGIHIHLLETKSEKNNCIKKYGKTPVELFEEYGVLDNRVIGVHCNYLSEKDFEIIRDKDFSCAHDPQSNYKMCSGYLNLKKFSNRDINIAIGTDGVCSSNSYDLFETLKIVSLSQKMITQDPTFPSSINLLKMATQGGLKSQGRVNEAGMIKPGLDADIIALKMENGMFPCFNAISNLVYSTNGSSVRMTMVRGNILYKDGIFTTIDAEETKRKLVESSNLFLRYRYI